MILYFSTKIPVRDGYSCGATLKGAIPNQECDYVSQNLFARGRAGDNRVAGSGTRRADTFQITPLDPGQAGAWKAARLEAKAAPGISTLAPKTSDDPDSSSYGAFLAQGYSG